jgi:hypothetical protein
MVRVAALLGTGAMCVAPFFIDTLPGKLCAICGLLLLTIQALDLKAYNLIILNVVGVAGYTFSLLGA